MKTSLSNTSLLFLLLIHLSAFAQPEWDKVSDLALNDLVETPGSIYYGLTDSTLVRTDWNQNTTFTITKGRQSDMQYDGNNGLWFSSSTLYKFNTQNQTFEVLDFNGNVLNNIEQITLDNSGIPWILNNGELFYCQQNKVHRYQVGGQTLTIEMIGESPKGILALKSLPYDSIYTLNLSGILSAIPLTPTLSAVRPNPTWGYFTPPFIRLLEENAQGEILFGPTRSGLSLYLSTYTQGAWKHTNMDVPSIGRGVNEMLLTDKGGLYISGNSHDRFGGFLKWMRQDTFYLSNFMSGFSERLIDRLVEGKDDLYLLNSRGIYRAPYQIIPTTYDAHLKSKELEFVLGPTGVMFMDSDESRDSASGSYVGAPEQIINKQASLFYSNNLFIGALDGTGTFYGSGDRFVPNESGASFYSGPLSTDYRFRRAWVHGVNKSTIDSHKLLSGLPGYVTPKSLQEWPAHGHPGRGQAACLAPFVDVDGDGFYRPELGDYPDIRGTHAVYAIFNDDEHQATNGYPHLGVEVHVMYYLLADHPDARVRHTLFAHYEVINRSSRDYQQLRIGNFTDMDLGCSQDDYVGCSPATATYYAYNGDSYDEDCRGAKGFGNNPPLAAVSCLSDTLYSFIYHNNSIDVRGDPRNPQEMYDYCRGIWRDGLGMVHGGSGHPSTGGTIPTRFMYPGQYGGMAPWTEMTSGNTPGDRRGVGSIGPYTLLAGEILRFDWMYYSYLDDQLSITQKQQQLDTEIQAIKAAHQAQNFKNNTYSCSGYTAVEESIEEKTNRFLVYPNPSSGDLFLSFPGTGKYQAMLIDISGRIVLNKDLNKSPNEVVEFSLSQLPKGLYILAIEGEGESYLSRVIIE